MSREIKLNPVGTIENREGRFNVIIQKNYREALRELEGFSHIIVLWWGNQADSQAHRDMLTAHQPYRKGPDTIGIFASRSEMRPNPVLMTIAEVTHIDMGRGIIELAWIDAETDSPVIDIKPYQPCSDRVKEVLLPDWCSHWPQWYEDSANFDWAAVFNF
jgi:tRNA-Thr(GGU) m(6)t(6)A37 methyltransferase TsaA